MRKYSLKVDSMADIILSREKLNDRQEENETQSNFLQTFP